MHFLRISCCVMLCVYFFLRSQEQQKHVKKKMLFSYLTEHVKHNVLHFDGKFHLQGVGIPQGGIFVIFALLLILRTFGQTRDISIS